MSRRKPTGLFDFLLEDLFECFDRKRRWKITKRYEKAVKPPKVKIKVERRERPKFFHKTHLTNGNKSVDGYNWR